MLKALKSSFENITKIRDGCYILDMFYSVSERERIKETYNACKEKIVQELVGSAVTQKNSMHKRLTYLNKQYSNVTVEMLRFQGLKTKERSMKEEVFGAKFFQEVNLHDIMATDSVLSSKEDEEMKNIFTKLVNQRIEEPVSGSGTASQFIVMRSLNYDGLLDINFKRDFFSMLQEARVLESLGISVYGNRQMLRSRHQQQNIEISRLCSLVTEYNVLMGRLSAQEKGIFRNRLILLERRLWNGIYKITWQNFNSIRSWISMCDETVLQVTKEVLEYKTVNKAINEGLKLLENNVIDFSKVGSQEDIRQFLYICQEKIEAHLKYTTHNCKRIAAYVHKVESFLEVSDRCAAPIIWDEYVTCIEGKVAKSCEEAMADSLRSLYRLLTGFKAKPMFRLRLGVTTKGEMTIGTVFDDLCTFLSELPNSLANTDRVSIKNDRVVKLFQSSNPKMQFKAIVDAFQTKVNKMISDVKNYFQSLSKLQDFISLKPVLVLEQYHSTDAFISCCENDLQKLDEVAEFLQKQHRKVWIDIFMIDLTNFIAEHNETLNTWREDFMGAILNALKERKLVIDDYMNQIRKMFGSREEMANPQKVEKLLLAIEDRVNDVKKIADILARTDYEQHLDKDMIARLQTDFEKVKREKEAALEYFARKRNQDMEKLQANILHFQQRFEKLNSNFESHGPFNLSWKSQEAQNELATILKKIDELKNLEIDIELAAKDLNWDYEKSDELTELMINVENLVEIWRVQGEWEKFQGELLQMSVSRTNTVMIISKIEELRSKVAQMAEVNIANELEVKQSLETSLPLYSDIVDVIQKLDHESLRARHWEKICSHCGIYDNTSFLENKTYEEVVSTLLEKELKPLLTIIGEASREHEVENNLANLQETLESLQPEFETNAYDVTIMINSGDIAEKLREVTVILQELQQNASSEPFEQELQVMKESIFIAYEKIRLFLSVERSLTYICETFENYALQLQLGRLAFTIQELSSSWAEVYDTVAEKNSVLDLVSQDLNKEIVVLKFMIMETGLNLENFLRTRMNVFPRLCYYLMQPTPQHGHERILTATHISAMFPQIKKLVYGGKSGHANEATAYINAYGQQKTFPTPIPVSGVPPDYFLQNLLDTTKKMFRAEIAEAISYFRHDKQDKINFSLHAYVIGRLVVFWSRLHLVMSSDDSEFHRWLVKTYDSQQVKLSSLQSTLINLLNTNGTSEDQLVWNRNMFSMENFVLNILKRFLQALSPEEEMAEMRKVYHASLKYFVNKENGDIQVWLHEKKMTFGYEEAGCFDLHSLHSHIEENIISMLTSLNNNTGAILQGAKTIGKTVSVNYMSMLLGRRTMIVAFHQSSGYKKLGLILSSLQSQADLICFKLSNINGVTASEFSLLYQTLCSMKQDSHYFQNDLTGISIKQKACARIICLADEQEEQVNLGKDFKGLKAAEPNLRLILKKAVQGYGHLAVPGLLDSVHELVLRIKEYLESSTPRHEFREELKKSETFQKVQEEFLYGDVNVKTLFKRFNSVAKSVGHYLFVELFEAILDNSIDKDNFDGSDLEQLCEQMQLDVTPIFKKQLTELHQLMQSHSAIIVHGPKMPGKTTVYEVCAKALQYQVHHFSTTAFTSSEFCNNFETFLTSLNHERKSLQDVPVLIVLEGPLIRELFELIIPLIMNKTIMLESGLVLTMGRKLKVLIETASIEDLNPQLAGIFRTFRVHQNELCWESVLKSRFTAIVKENRTTEIFQEVLHHATVFLDCRAKVGIKDNYESLYINLNNFLQLLNAVKLSLEPEPLERREILLFVSLFCFSQDLNDDQKIKMESIIRRKLHCGNVPTHESMYEFFYDKGWKEYSTELSVTSKVLPKHRKIVKISHILMEAMVSIDVVGVRCAGKKTLIQDIAQNYETDMCLLFKNTQHLHHQDIVRTIQWAMIRKENSRNDLYPLRGSLRMFIDDVNTSCDHVREAVNFLSKHRQWLFGNGPVNLNQMTIMSTIERDSLIYTNGKNYVLKMSELGQKDMTSIFSQQLSEHFENFEVEIHFHMKKLVKASVFINNMHLGSSKRPFFPLQDSLKIVHGLLRARRDCQDTPLEMSNLWIHEVLRTYRDKLQSAEHKAEFDAIFAEIVKRNVGNFDMNEKQQEIFGDFINPLGFYTKVSTGEVKRFVDSQMKKYYCSNDKDLLIIKTPLTIKLFCLLQRSLTHKSGHLLIHGDSVFCTLSLLRLTAFNIESKLFLILPNDATKPNRWRSILRSVVRFAGMDDKHCTLFVRPGTQKSIGLDNFFSTLESLLSLGMDLSLFEKDELQVVLEKEHYVSDVSKNVLKNFHCVLQNTAPNTESFMKHFDTFHLGPFSEDEQSQMVRDIMQQNEESEQDQDLIRVFIKMSQITENDNNVKSFHSFVQFFHNNYDTCKNFLSHIADIIQMLVVQINQTISDSEEKVSSLTELKDLNKKVAVEQSELHKENAALKKEIDELNATIDQHVKVVGEDLLTVSRSKLMVGQEMAASYALYQMKIDDLRTLINCDFFLVQYKKVIADEEAVLKYVAKFHEILDANIEDSPDNISTLPKVMATLSEEKINILSDHAELGQLRKDIPSEVKTKCTILEHLIEIQRRVENLAKVIKMKNNKYNRIESLNKNVGKEQDIILKLRRERQQKNHILDANVKKITDMQSEMSSRLEQINHLDQYAMDFKNSLAELNQLLSILGEWRSVLDLELRTVKGQLLLTSAFLSHCGSKISAERKQLVDKWKALMSKENIKFSNNFLKVPILHSLQFRTAAQYKAIPTIYENLSISDFLPNPLLIIDPSHISLEYVFTPGKTGIIYCGDPEFQSEFSEFLKKFDAIIVRHFAFDSKIFQQSMEMALKQEEMVKVFHVVNSISDQDWKSFDKLHIIRFDLDRNDVKNYISFNLKSSVKHLETEEEKAENLKNNFEKVQKEVEQFISNIYSLSDTSQVRPSVTRLKKLKGQSNSTGIQIQPSSSSKVAEISCQSFARFYTFLTKVPMKYLKVVPLKKFFPTFQNIQDKFQESSSPLKQDIALLLAESQMRDYITSMSPTDFIIFAFFLLLYLYIVANEKEASRLGDYLKTLSSNNPLTTTDLNQFADSSFVSQSVMKSIEWLHGKERLTRENLVQNLNSVTEKLLKLTFTNECNLEKLYHQQHNKIFLLNAQNFIHIFEIICEFAKKIGVAKPTIFNPGEKSDLQFW